MTVVNLSAEFQEVVLESAQISCRTCRNFIRVRKDGIRGAHHMRGFCQLGGEQHEYNYGLYQSSTCAKDCAGYVLDEYSLETFIKEQEIQNLILDLKEKMFDEKSDEYKLIREFARKSKVLVCHTKNVPMEMAVVSDFFESDLIFYDWFYSCNTQRFQWLYNRKAMPFREYDRLMLNVRNTVVKNAYDEVIK